MKLLARLAARWLWLRYVATCEEDEGLYDWFERIGAVPEVTRERKRPQP